MMWHFTGSFFEVLTPSEVGTACWKVGLFSLFYPNAVAYCAGASRLGV
jgi:hypothetical protein